MHDQSEKRPTRGKLLGLVVGICGAGTAVIQIHKDPLGLAAFLWLAIFAGVFIAALRRLGVECVVADPVSRTAFLITGSAFAAMIGYAMRWILFMSGWGFYPVLVPIALAIIVAVVSASLDWSLQPSRVWLFPLCFVAPMFWVSAGNIRWQPSVAIAWACVGLVTFGIGVGSILGSRRYIKKST